MKIIDLLNKIANGEEVPKKIRINNVVYEYRGYMYYTEKANYQDIEDYLFGKWNFNILNDEVEIQKCFTNGWTKSSENKRIEEEKEIPEKLEILPDNEHYSNKVLYGKINEIVDYLDYLKSKGE